ncbi:MAG: trehalose-6-phosphate synthase [Candidatus Thermoplasmatota archaeon]|nr:trehalose-6-phosphate synthase [Candidatus Thermoplasmatota archaeon]
MELVVVTSRAPFSHDISDGKEIIRHNVGGVATALEHALSRSGGIWVCWGDGKIDERYSDESTGEFRVKRIFLTREEKNGFYDQYSNGTLWPVFHYFRTKAKFIPKAFEFYRKVNRKFMDAVLENLSDSTMIWIHDYQLCLVPGMLKEQGVRNKIAFTWHIPWVSPEFFSILPEASEILKSICKSDLVTFHTRIYRKNFVSSVQSILGYSPEKIPRVMSIPLGIDTKYYRNGPESHLRIENIQDKKLIFSIDRLDYTKGLSNRLVAFDHFMTAHPEFRGKFVYVMIVTPSRTNVSEYQMMKRELEMNIGRVGGKHGDLEWRPILYIYRKIGSNMLRALYKRADVALITPLIDGLNLVSKEFVSANDHGVLIISKFAGSSNELEGAIKVNPYNTEETSNAIYRALTMPQREARKRMASMRNYLDRHDLKWWTSSIEKALSGGIIPKNER